MSALLGPLEPSVLLEVSAPLGQPVPLGRSALPVQMVPPVPSAPLEVSALLELLGRSVLLVVSVPLAPLAPPEPMVLLALPAPSVPQALPARWDRPGPHCMEPYTRSRLRFGLAC